MITGINYNSPVWMVVAEQSGLPPRPPTAEVGGTEPTSSAPSMPAGFIAAGIISLGLASMANLPTTLIEITSVSLVTPADDNTAIGLKSAYETLRTQMRDEGVPFLNAQELESEITERKGIRS